MNGHRTPPGKRLPIDVSPPLTDGKSRNQGEWVGGKSRVPALLQSEHFMKFWCSHFCLHPVHDVTGKNLQPIDLPPSKTVKLVETNKVSYLPLVPALFCQVTRLCFSFLLPFTLFSCTSLLLSLSLLSSSGSVTLPSLVDKPSCWVWALAFPQKVTVVLSPSLFGSFPGEI